jgi:hypothetical protein
VNPFLTATHVRRLGAPVITGELRNRLASKDVNCGLRCDLEHLPDAKPARVPLTLERREGPFRGFDDELQRTSGADYGRIVHRRALHRRGVRSMHVAIDEAGEPMYVQWLITPADQVKLGGSQWPQLKAGEVLLEFAYTFTPFRGLGVMGDAMGRLLRVAADQGARVAFTYVRDDNVPSLRGCSKVGFDLDHMRTTTHRMGISRNRFHPPAADDRQRWEQATAERPKA